MEQLLALILVVVGVIIAVVFTPLAWRRAREGTGDKEAAFAQLLAEEMQALENRMAQLTEEYRSLSRQVEAKREAAAPAEKEKPVLLAEREEREAAVKQLPEIELYRRVYQAYDAGKSVTEIAKELGRGKGEIELILNLRR